MNDKMRIKSDQELHQNEIEKLNSKYNVQVFSTNLPVGKAFFTEQNVREF